MRKKNLTKAVETTVAPNPKEVDIWVEPKDNDTVSLKYYDYHDNEWVGGDSDDGSSNGDEHVIYYSFGEKTNIYEIYNNDEVKYSIAGVRTAWGEINPDTCMYGSYNAMNDIFGSMSQDFYPDAFIFAPISIRRNYDNSIGMSSVSYEQLCEKYPDLPKATRITAEEYWQYLKAA